MLENVHKFTQFTHFLSFTKTTSPGWTIYSWKGFYLIGFPLLLRTNYRCVESLNISVDVAKCVGKRSQIHPVHSLFVRYKKLLVLTWTIYSWQGFNSLVCRLMLKTNYRCVQSLNISVDDAKCMGNVHTLIHQVHSLLDWYKKDLSWLNNLFMAKFQLIRMSSYAKNKLQMFSVTQHQCRRRQMCGKCSLIHPVHSPFCPFTKNDLSWLNNLFMERFLLKTMSTYVKNKPQMCWVTQHQCIRCQICGKCSQIHPVHLHSLCPTVTKNDLSSYKWTI